MKRLRSSLATLLLSFGSALHAANAVTPSDEALMLATCQARYTAVLEHTWLMRGDPAAARMRRDLFAAMLDATVRNAPDTSQLEHKLLLHKISQKRAASALLNTAWFGTDPRRSRIALGLITGHLASCDNVLIGRAPIGA